jgi:hypothetical protein
MLEAAALAPPPPALNALLPRPLMLRDSFSEIRCAKSLGFAFESWTLQAMHNSGGGNRMSARTAAHYLPQETLLVSGALPSTAFCIYSLIRDAAPFSPAFLV